MVAPDKVGVLLWEANKAVRTMRRTSSTLRMDVPAQAASLDGAAVNLSKAAHHARIPAKEEDFARLLAVAGRSVRTMQLVCAALRESGEEWKVLDAAAESLKEALLRATRDTVPILIEDIEGDE